MTSVWPDVSGACLPPQVLAALAGLRHDPGVRVVLADGLAWVFWEPGREEVLARLIPLPGAAFFTRREGTWYRHGSHLPAFEVPTDEEALPLHRVIFPDTVRPEFPTVADIRPEMLRLERDDRPRPTRAMRCPLSALAAWAETAPTAQLAGIEAARCADLVLLRGDSLPLLYRNTPEGQCSPHAPREVPHAEREVYTEPHAEREVYTTPSAGIQLPGAERFWGERLLVPLGLRPWPELPEAVLLEALGIKEGELLVLDGAGGEVMSLDVFQPLTRTTVRLARRAPS